MFSKRLALLESSVDDLGRHGAHNIAKVVDMAERWYGGHEPRELDLDPRSFADRALWLHQIVEEIRGRDTTTVDADFRRVTSDNVQSVNLDTSTQPKERKSVSQKVESYTTGETNVSNAKTTTGSGQEK